ncbi:mitochondrial ribosomal death-associated protein 3-domain-containing protein [Gamsiella multidivaricata]|uniref:mitochondrial ribosomal death-associated protein 3-domain-containing protein n=1 Tax=Gamsiella multidivaricata TaxID=101098 RepID=UPI002220A1DC|nr:mitochondrial ribosomal death-associated protein 3-domain-containing protein [Gamsiella multidivaricata]KAG0371276.1 37S ribosomal protein S23 mitochondrial [Gamsiella multidivaricata]KAI7823894.1 mitochondrial ribosomal death-associated protein 3-domain-containing protein [Gamsiella multidivaricata]
MAHRLLTSTPLLSRTQQTLAARVRAAVPAQYANYVTASTVVMAGGKAKKASAPVRAKGQANSFRRKKVDDEGKNEGAIGGAGRLNEKYYKPATPVKVDEFLPSTATKEHIGQVLGFPSAVLPALSQTSYPTLLSEQFALIKPAALVVREPTVALLERVDKAMKTPSSQSRIVLTGDSGSGKSALLLQTVSHCLSAGWVVVYVPKASTWMNSSFAYSKAANSTSFVQPLLASNLVGQINSVNKSVLSKIVTSEKVRVGRHEIEKGTTLSALLETGVKDQFAAQDIMEVFMKEMSAQKEIPTLIAVDEVNAFFRSTQYLSQDGEELDPEHLKLPKLFLNYISGKSSFEHGAIVAAISDTLLANKSELLEIALGIKEVSPYKKLSPTIMPWTEGLARMDVPNYTRTEAKGVFDYYRKGNIFYDAASESLFLNKFIASAGNPRKFFTACAKGV